MPAGSTESVTQPTAVLDASLVLAWALPDEDPDGRAEAVLAHLARGEILVPAHWRAEVGNGVLMAYRRGRLALGSIAPILAQASTLRLTVDAEGAHDAWSEPLRLSLASGLTLYDAIYLELAIRNGLSLATLDAALREAARNRGVPLLPA